MNLKEHFTCAKIFVFALPNIGTMLAITSFQMIDGYFAANFLGVNAFAAINLVFPLIMVFSAPGFMIGSGGNAIISKTKGEGRLEQARKYFTMLIFVLFADGIICGVLMWLFLPEILVLIGASDELLPYALEFGRILFVFLPCILTSTAFQSLWLAAGKPELGFRLSVLEGVIIVVLDWLLIVQMNFGIDGAALATALAMTTFTIITLRYFLRPNSSGMHFTRFNFDLEKVIFVCYNGISEMADAISVNIVELFMNLRLMKLFGEVGVAAFGVFSYVNEVFLSIFFALSTATVTLVGFNYGRRNFSEIKSLTKRFSAMTITFGVLMTACATIFSEEIAKIYVGYDENAYKLTITVLKTCSLMFLLYGFNLFVSAFFTGMEKSTLSAIIAFMQSLIMPIFFILLLPELFGANSIWFSTFFATLMTSILALRLLLKHFRRKKLA